jgi:hypothetical protein
LIVLAFGIFPSKQGQISRTIQTIRYNKGILAMFFAFHTAFLSILNRWARHLQWWADRFYWWARHFQWWADRFCWWARHL